MSDKQTSQSVNELSAEGARELESLRVKLGLPSDSTFQQVLNEVVRLLCKREDTDIAEGMTCKTAIVWVTRDQRADADRACIGVGGLQPPIQVVENPAITTTGASEAYWRYEVPESALEQHPEWKVMPG